MQSATTKGMIELDSFRNRVARDFGRKSMTWEDFQFINDHIEAIVEKLIEMSSNDVQRLTADERIAG